jgi:transcriptional regulator with XRE-family HTH domain
MRSRFAAPALLLHVGEDVNAMFNKAVVVYFRELREGQGSTQESLAEAAGCGKRTVERIERNEGPVMPDSLERLMTVLGALPDEVNYLMTNKSATEAEARELAQALLQRDPVQRWTTFSLSTSAQDLSQIGVQTYIRTLREHQAISRKAIADMLGVRLAMYADWEAGDGTTMPFPILIRITTYVGGSLEDLEQIALARDGYEALGRRLADERLAAVQQRPRSTQTREVHNGLASDKKVLHRVLAVEGLLHYALSLLKRALPGDAEEIERTSAQ